MDFFRKKYHHQTCSTFNGFVNTLCHRSLLPAATLFVVFLPSCLRRCLCWISFSSTASIFPPVRVGASSFQPSCSLVLCFSYHLKINILFFVRHKRVGKVLIFPHVSSQRWFRNTRRRLNNSIRRESRNETSENRRCYVPMTQTPLTPVFIRDIPAPIRRILQLSQKNNIRGSPVTPSTGQLGHYRWRSPREEVTCSQMATPLGATIFNMAAKSSSVADVREQTTCRQMSNGSPRRIPYL